MRGLATGTAREKGKGRGGVILVSEITLKGVKGVIYHFKGGKIISNGTVLMYVWNFEEQMPSPITL